MADEKPIPSSLVLAFIAFLGGGTVDLTGRLLVPARPDPWTGTQAKSAHELLQKDIDFCKAELGEGRSREHDTIQGLKYRVTTIERQLRE